MFSQYQRSPSTKAFMVLLLAAISHVAAQAQSQAPAAKQGSVSTVISSLILNAVILAVLFCVFIIFRPRFKKIYAARTYLPIPQRRIDALPSSLFGWFPVWIKTPNNQIYKKNGLDSYMFVEFLEMMLWIFVPTWLITWAVLMPAYGARTSGGKSGFTRFTFAQLGPTKNEQSRKSATLLLQYAFTFWLLYNVYTRMQRFVKLRHEFLLSPTHSSTAQAKTVLITGIPNEVLSEKKLSAMYSSMPGGVSKIWINRNLQQLPDLFDQRAQLCEKLEAAETTLIKAAYKAVKKGKVEPVQDTELNAELADKYVARKNRPTHRLGSVPFFGQKVDTIDYCREEIARLNQEIQDKRAEVHVDYTKYPPQNSAFILFNTQIAAHMAVKSHAHHLPYRMVERHVEAHPKDVIWSNLNMNPYERKVRTAIGWAITIGLIIFWSIPVAFVGTVSNISGIAPKVVFLKWILKLPPVVLGIIQGILPTVLLALLNMLLPIFLRLVARLSGVPTKTRVELTLQTRFAAFQIVQNFLVLTIASGTAGQITTYLKEVGESPAKLPGLLADSIPNASIFFLSFIALQGLSGGASLFAQLVPLVVYYVKKFLLASTPRKVWHIDHDMSEIAWGTLFPTISLIGVIATGYVVIAPIVNGFASVTFFLFYLGYKYLFLYVYETKPQSETSGLFFPRAINHLLAGLYVEMVMVCAMLFTSQYTTADGKNHQSAIPQGAFMVILIVIVAGFHYILYDSFNQLSTSLPLSLVLDQSEAAAAAVAGDDVRSSGDTNTEKKSLMPASPGQPPNAEALPVEKKGAESTPQPSKEEMEKAFYHPAMTGEQRPIWIPNDKLGIGRVEVAAAEAAGLFSTHQDTSVNEKGQVETDAYEPPGEPRV